MDTDHHGYLLRYTESVWSNENPEAAMAFFHPDARISGVAGIDDMRPEDMVTLVQTIFMLVEPPQYRVLHIIADGDRIAYVVACEARSRRTGLPVTFSGQISLVLRDGLIVEAHNHFDMIGFFTQLGLLPADLLETVLAGSVAA